MELMTLTQVQEMLQQEVILLNYQIDEHQAQEHHGDIPCGETGIGLKSGDLGAVHGAASSDAWR